MAKNSIPPIHNWSEYTPALIKRGALTAWFDKGARQRWQARQDGSRGRPKVYSDDAIQCVLIFRAVYRLPLRAAQGLVQSMFEIMGLDFICPNYTTLCRRAKTLKVRLPKIKRGEGLHLLFDSTGLKIYGSGEWMARKHGLAKRKGWRKLHIGICADTQMVVVAGLSNQRVADPQAMPDLLNAFDGDIATVTGDGAYDAKGCYKAIAKRDAKPIIPPRKGAKKQVTEIPALVPRDEAIDRIIRAKRGKRRWKQEVGYHRRSLVETSMFRIKSMLGSRLSNRLLQTQATEIFTRLSVLNQMTLMGMPKRQRLAA